MRMEKGRVVMQKAASICCGIPLFRKVTFTPLAVFQISVMGELY